MEKPKHAAYLVVELDTEGPVPFVRSVAIASSRSITARPETVCDTMLHAEGNDFQEAQERLLDLIHEIDGFHWTLKYLGINRESWVDDHGNEQRRWVKERPMYPWRHAVDRAMRAAAGTLEAFIEVLQRV